jgi:hypothetical protein
MVSDTERLGGDLYLATGGTAQSQTAPQYPLDLLNICFQNVGTSYSADHETKSVQGLVRLQKGLGHSVHKVSTVAWSIPISTALVQLSVLSKISLTPYEYRNRVQHVFPETISSSLFVVPELGPGGSALKLPHSLLISPIISVSSSLYLLIANHNAPLVRGPQIRAVT